MKTDKSETSKTATLIGITQLIFILFLYLAPYIANLNIPFSPQALWTIRLTGIISVLGGLGLFFWLFAFKPKFQSAWKSFFIYLFSILLIEYWYFGNRLLSLITK